MLKNSLATNNVNNGKFPSLLCRHYSIEAHYAVSFVLLFPSKGSKGRQHMRSPRNVCAGGYGLNHSCPYNYLLLKMPIILFYKTDCKTATTTFIFHLVKLGFFKEKRKRQNFTSKGLFFQRTLCIV